MTIKKQRRIRNWQILEGFYRSQVCVKCEQPFDPYQDAISTPRAWKDDAGQGHVAFGFTHSGCWKKDKDRV